MKPPSKFKASGFHDFWMLFSVSHFQVSHWDKPLATFSPGVLHSEEWLLNLPLFDHLLMFQNNAQNVRDIHWTTTSRHNFILFNLPWFLSRSKKKNDIPITHDPSSMVGSCWCWSRSSSLDNKTETRSEIFGQPRFGSFSKLNLICLFHPILGEIFHFYWYMLQLDIIENERMISECLAILMIVLSLFYFQMKFKIGIFLLPSWELTYPLPRHIWSWFSFSPGGRVPWRVNPSPKWKFLQPQEKLRITFPLKLNPADVDSRESRLDIILCLAWDLFLVYPLPSKQWPPGLVHFLVRVSLLTFTFYCERVGNTPKIYIVLCESFCWTTRENYIDVSDATPDLHLVLQSWRLAGKWLKCCWAEPSNCTIPCYSNFWNIILRFQLSIFWTFWKFDFISMSIQPLLHWR